MGPGYMFTAGAGGGVIPTQAIGRGPEKGWLLGTVGCCFQKEESLGRQKQDNLHELLSQGLLGAGTLRFFLPGLQGGTGWGETVGWAGDSETFFSSVGQRSVRGSGEEVAWRAAGCDP